MDGRLHEAPMGQPSMRGWEVNHHGETPSKNGGLAAEISWFLVAIWFDGFDTTELVVISHVWNHGKFADWSIKNAGFQQWQMGLFMFIGHNMGENILGEKLLVRDDSDRMNMNK